MGTRDQPLLAECPGTGAATAFIFPGQASQYPGMGRDLGLCGADGRELIHRVEQFTGLPVNELMVRADADALADPHIAQVLVFTASSALLHLTRRQGTRPDVVSGHSLGEYTALVAAGCLEWEDALALVDARGRAMAETARHSPGAMAAIVGPSPADVTDWCLARNDPGHPVVVANYNSSLQTVISGSAAAVEQVCITARLSGAVRVRLLDVGGAYHSPLMADAEKDVLAVLATTRFVPPQIPFVTSVSGRTLSIPVDIRAALATQITAPVRWDTTVRSLAAKGVQTFIEVGPGHVLTGLGRQTARSARHITLPEYLRRRRREAASTA